LPDLFKTKNLFSAVNRFSVYLKLRTLFSFLISQFRIRLESSLKIPNTFYFLVNSCFSHQHFCPEYIIKKPSQMKIIQETSKCPTFLKERAEVFKR